jgi:hypothetical protein
MEKEYEKPKRLSLPTRQYSVRIVLAVIIAVIIVAVMAFITLHQFNTSITLRHGRFEITLVNYGIVRVHIVGNGGFTAFSGSCDPAATSSVVVNNQVQETNSLTLHDMPLTYTCDKYYESEHRRYTSEVATEYTFNLYSNGIQAIRFIPFEGSTITVTRVENPTARFMYCILGFCFASLIYMLALFLMHRATENL